MTPRAPDAEGDDASFDVCRSGFSVTLIWCFLAMVPFFHFGLNMLVLCHCILKVHYLVFVFVF